jgi:hypothetical protein
MSLTTPLPVYRSKEFVSLDMDPVLLKSKFNLSPHGAYILSLLLREYQVHLLNFDTTAPRQHIFAIRNAMRAHLENDVIISMGMGMYAISDQMKLAIKDYIYE